MRNWAIFVVGFVLGVLALPTGVVIYQKREQIALRWRRAHERLSVWWEERRAKR